jgi:hypothetical protein
VECKKSGGGGSPASERGGGDSVKEWWAGWARLPFGFVQSEREGEQVRDGGEAEARAGCYGVERVGATGIQAVDGGQHEAATRHRSPTRDRGVAHVREGGVRLGRWAESEAAAR